MIQKSDQNTEEESYFCSDCGREVSADANYCPNCGADIREVVEEDNESAPLQSVVARNTKPQAVSVVDINMPFWSMVSLMVKISLASTSSYHLGTHVHGLFRHSYCIIWPEFFDPILRL